MRGALLFTWVLMSALTASPQRSFYQKSLDSPKAPLVLKKKVAIIGSGIAGAGKSTLFKALRARLANCYYLDKDVIDRALLKEHPYFSEYYFDNVKFQSYDVILALAEESLSNGPDAVILDGYFGDKLSLFFMEKFLHAKDFETKVIYFYCSFKVNKERLIHRGEPRDQEKIENFDEHYQKMEAIHLREIERVPHLAINTEEDAEKNLAKILHYLAE